MYSSSRLNQYLHYMEKIVHYVTQHAASLLAPAHAIRTRRTQRSSSKEGCLAGLSFTLTPIVSCPRNFLN